MKKFRKVLDGLTTSSPASAGGSPSCGSAAGTPTAAATPRELDIQETLMAEHFHICKVGERLRSEQLQLNVTSRSKYYVNIHHTPSELTILQQQGWRTVLTHGLLISTVGFHFKLNYKVSGGVQHTKPNQQHTQRYLFITS